MPSLQLIKTFVQISDLHIGAIDPQTQNSRVPEWLKKLPWLEGLRGHSGFSLMRLAEFFGDIQHAENAELIVTGDVTSCGDSDEYDTARTFLGSDLQPPKGEDLGLRVKDWNRRAVPGNHDHWPGRPVIFGGPPIKELWSTYRATPFTEGPLQLAQGYSLRIFGINTDANVSSKLANRLLARGSFRKELAQLVVPPASKKEIRVLLVHHSSQYESPDRFGVLEMTIGSRDALFEWMADNGISVLLCGHTHLPRLTEFKTTVKGLTYRLYEACSGATTILTSLPYDATSITGTRSKLNAISNSLLVHRLKLVSDKPELLWQTDTYFETPYGFELWSDLRAELPSERGPYHVEFCVSRALFL
jgi:hypothetical protein